MLFVCAVAVLAAPAISQSKFMKIQRPVGPRGGGGGTPPPPPPPPAMHSLDLRYEAIVYKYFVVQ